MANPHFYETSPKLSWLASFYRRFVRDFSLIVAPMTKVLKFKTFEWNKQAHFAFEEIKHRLTSAPILALRSFSKVFELEHDAFRVGIAAVLSQRNDQ